MTRNTELGDFLRSSRSRLAPGDVGLPASPLAGGRRVPGLRREEVAQLAGMSADYYAKLEQGRTKQASRSVLSSLSRALRLNPTEHDYLLALAEPPTRSLASAEATELVRPGARRLLDAVIDAPAFILGRGTAILGMNDMARALFFDIDARPVAERNLTVWTFLDPEARTRYVDWESVAADNAAMLRLDVASSPEDPGLASLVGSLMATSEDFRRAWHTHHVFECTFGRKALFHPLVGRMDLDYETFPISGAQGQTLHIYSAAPGSTADSALSRLVSDQPASGS
ncbi:helix-turn-helix domain-containing protein [Microbacterium sp. 22215]|uniref:helix-turn-helix domain-containing protein n=1 Tax=Microbacterium sp. 22215 TaxID=3453893 RepID=UPI003F84D1D3